MAAKKNLIIATGKRKTAVARATLQPGKGAIRINGLNIDSYTPEIARLKIKEPLILSGKTLSSIDIDISVHGGGVMSQTEAVRLAIARALVEKDEKLKEVFLDYDRQLLVADDRQREVRKPNCQGSARSKRQKSYR